MTVDGEKEEAVPNGGPHASSLESTEEAGGHNWTSGLEKIVTKTGLLGHSDSSFDAWLTAASAQIGNVILTLPTTLAQMGYAWAVVCLVLFGLLGAWCTYLLTWMYFEYKAKLERQQALKGKRVLQYHEVIQGLAGNLLGYITFFFIIGSLVLAGVIQIVSSSSNLYYANDSLSKRDWALVVGAISLLSIFLPNFRHIRGVALFGVVSTTIVALYLLIASIVHGQKGQVLHTGPKDNQAFFTGVTNTIFTFGGHGITIEIMDAMKRPQKFKYIYATVVMYSLVIFLPSCVAVYWAFGDILLTHNNALGVLPASGWRTFAISCMLVHQVMAYIIFVVPVFIALEKIVGLHTGSYIWRTIVRIPVVLTIWLVGLAIPFFGLINSVMGAFIVTFGIYSIPPLAFLIQYRTAAARESSVYAPPLIVGRSWVLLFTVNALIGVGTAVVGLGFGGWASIRDLTDSIHTFGVFSACYQCTPAK